MSIRSSGDLVAQRRHVWTVFSGLIGDAGAEPAFESWRGEGAVFASGPAEDWRRGIRGFARPAGAEQSDQGGGAPVMAYTLYNEAAYQHIRRHQLHRSVGLTALGRSAPSASIPAFPADAIVVKTAWWPVAAEGRTAMPVWDPELNPPLAAGNPYVEWRRITAIDPSPLTAGVRPVEFMGRTSEARAVGLGAFHRVAVDAQMAAQLGRDSEASRTAVIALGRPVQAGDTLVLVGLNLMTRELEDWVWAAFWWHDKGEQGPFAHGRPAAIRGAWKNYLMQAAFDSQTPAAADGGAHICFNPWLEGRFPGGAQGGGATSNCMSCHSRASYPAENFLPVTRGAPDPKDPALAPDRLRTSFLWSLPMHAQD